MANNKIERRTFIKQAAMGTAALMASSSSRVLGANDRVRVGIIGPGARGQELIKLLLAIPNAELVAAADIYTRRHAEVPRLVRSVQVFDDHHRLLDANDISAFILPSP